MEKFNVSVKKPEDISNATNSSTKLYTSSLPHLFFFLFSVRINEIMRSVNSSSVIVTIDPQSEFASPIF